MAGRAAELVAAVFAQAAVGAVPAPALVCGMCAAGLSMTGAALVLLSSAGLDRVVAATEGIAATAEDLQFDLGEGPGVDASRGRRC